MTYEVENPYPPYESVVAETFAEALAVKADFERDIHKRGRRAIVREVPANGGHRQ